MNAADKIKNMNNQEKNQFLDMVENDEERFFHDYTEELNILIYDPDTDIRARAVLCLWDYPTKHFLGYLLDSAEKEPDDKVRKYSIIVLGRYIFEGSMEGYDLELNDPITTEDIAIEDYNDVKSILLKIYKDSSRSNDDRRIALEALSFSSEDEIEELIAGAYKSDDKQFRLSAIFSMGRNGSERWDDIILKELSNTDKEIQMEAVKAAGEAGIEKAGEELLKLTYLDDLDLVKQAVWSLGQTGWEDAFDRLYEISEKAADKELRGIAAVAIEEWHSMCGNDDEYFEEDDDDIYDD